MAAAGLAEVADLSALATFHTNDMVVDAKDIDAVHAAIAAGSEDAKYDLNDDDVVSDADATYLIEEILHTRRGDADLNGNVDFVDFLALSKDFGKQTGSSWSEGDFNGDGEISFEDFLLLSANFGFESEGL